MKLRIFATGGTFDKIYNESDGSLIFKETNLSHILNDAKSRVNIEIETIMLIDSLYMKDYHRQEILNKCKSCSEDRIVVTHGTDTMVETAKLLGKEIKDKTIILTGSMVPCSVVNSDAHFNLGCAMAFAQILPKGVYISMHGKIFNCNNARKNKETNEFEEIE